MCQVIPVKNTMETKPSYWHQTAAEPLLPLTVGKVLDIAANRWPDREALVSVYQHQRFTYTEIHHRITAFAAGIVRLGLAPGDRLAIWGCNSSEWQCTYLAAASIGVITAKLDPACAPGEVLSNLNKIKPHALVCAEYYNKNNRVQDVNSIKSQLGNPIIIVISEKHYPGTVRFNDVMLNISSELLDKVQELKKLVQPDDGCDIIFTSGTTGNPKAATLSHHSLLNNMLISGRRGQYEKGVHKWCATTQFCHLSGSAGAILSSLCFGMTLIIPGSVYNAEEVVNILNEHRCTIVIGIPSQCVDIIKIATDKGVRFPYLQRVLVGGAPVSPALVQALYKTLESAKILVAYGMTETCGMTFMVTPNDSQEKVTTTVGYLTDHTEMKIVDTEGRMVPMGTPGELWVRGYCIMLGYWGEEDKTREVIQDGWLKTGDQFVMMENGYGRVVGRLKEMIIRQNQNIFPLEIEKFLQGHPDILDVQAFGVPDPNVSEEMCAYVRTRENIALTEQDVKDFCKGQIADWKIPRYILFVEDFPRSATGKVVKKQLKQMAMEKLGLNKGESLLHVPDIHK